MNKKLRLFLIIVLTLIFIGSAGMYISRELDYKRGEELYDEALDRFVIQLPEEEEKNPQGEGGHRPDLKPEEPDEPEKPAAPAIPPVTMDFEALAEINKDIIGWITIPDTKVNYPLLKGPTNDTYLRHAYNGQYSRMGSIFMEAQCSADFSDKHTIIYGHNMRNSTMFSPLLNYASQSYYDKHRFFYIYTPEGHLKYEIFSAHMVELPSEVYTIGFKTAEAFDPFVRSLTDQTVIASNIFPGGDEQVVTLSTCSSTNDKNLRFVVHGRLVEDTRGQ